MPEPTGPAHDEMDAIFERLRVLREEQSKTIQQIKTWLAESRRAEARAFAEKGLPAWTGNNPELLASFYAEDAFYLDPAIPEGVRGRSALLEYFRKLLGHNPNWVWTQTEAIPMEDGFLNKWLAKIPVGDTTLSVVGVCFVQFDDAGKIQRNEVYFSTGAIFLPRLPGIAVAEAATAGSFGRLQSFGPMEALLA